MRSSITSPLRLPGGKLARTAIITTWIAVANSLSHAGEREPHALNLTAAYEAGSDNHVESEKPWHVEFGIRDSHTKLAETEEMLEHRLNAPMRLDWANLFDPPRTPIDRKSEFLLTTFYAGAGRQESDWLIWTVYLGGGMGRDHDHQRVLNVNLEVSFKYAYVYTGANAEIYPWKAPRREDFTDWKDRLYAGRPFLSAGLETGYVSAEGRGNYKIAPLPRTYQDKAIVRDWITSLNLGAGWNFPLNRRWAIVLTGDYRFHTYRPDEYNGWTLTTALRYNFP